MKASQALVAGSIPATRLKNKSPEGQGLQGFSALGIRLSYSAGVLFFLLRLEHLRAVWVSFGYRLGIQGEHRMDANKTPTGKNAKGVVSVEVFRGRLRLRFRYAGQRYSLGLGLPDSKVNRLAAEQRANSIERDIACGRFDSSLASYKPESVLSVESPDIESENIPSILELWEAYTQYKASSLKESTKGYHAILRKLFDRVSNVSVLDALQVKAGLEAVTTVHQTKRALMQLNAACKWGVKHGILNANPYEGMANEMPKYRYQLEPKPNAFSEEERDQVIQAFKNHKGTWNGRGLAGMGYAQKC